MKEGRARRRSIMEKTSASYIMTKIWQNFREHGLLLLAVLLATLSFSEQARAQRTMDGQFFLGVEGHWPLGAAIGTGQYIRWGYWHAGVTADRISRAFISGIEGEKVSLEFYQPMAEGGLMPRILSTRNRGLNVYTGASLMVGIEYFDPFKRLPDNVVVILPSGADVSYRKFIFGLCPRVEMELYMGPRVALVAAARAPLTFGSQMGWAHVTAALGLRVNMDW